MKSIVLRLFIPLLLIGSTGGCAFYARHNADSQINQPRIASNSQGGYPGGISEMAVPGTKSGNSVHTVQFRPNSKVTPSPDNEKIAQKTAQLLEKAHYLHHNLDNTYSEKLYKEYLDTLDSRHLYFTQEDMAEFEKYRFSMGQDLIQRGDLEAAYAIYNRLTERLDQQAAYAAEILKNEKFTYTGDEFYDLDRKHATYAKDTTELKQIWHEYFRYEYLQEKLSKKKPEEIVTSLTRRYNRLARTLHENDGDDVLEFFLNSLAHVYDPHSDYMGKSTLENFNMQMKLSLFGIGALLGSEDGYCKIDQLTPGGPAMRGKQLQAGDRIVGVAQGNDDFVDVVEMKIDKIVSFIRGPKGTTVRLNVIPKDSPDASTRKIVTIIRDEIKLDEQEAKAKIIDMTAPSGGTLRMGVIELPSFYADFEQQGKGGKSATTDVARLVKKLKTEKVAGIILDLRNNPGGSLTEAIRLTGLFVKSGTIVQVVSSNGRIEKDEDDDPSMLYGGPLVVLTSKGSASASEIAAGALQDYGRALIVGDSSTFGKGTVQTIRSLGDIVRDVHGDPGALKLTIQKFYRATGESTQKKGVVPDIILPSLGSYIEYGETTLDNPMPWDKIDPANYDHMNLVQPYLAELKKRSSARISSDKDFKYLLDDIEQYKKLIAEKKVSLNEQRRLKEKQQAEEKIVARKKERKSRAASKDKVYALTLKQVDTPGLPPLYVPKDAIKAPGEIISPADDAPQSADTKVTGPPLDITLNEAEKILSDLIALSSGRVAVVKPLVKLRH